MLGGCPAIPVLITKHRSGYSAALDAADESLRRDGTAHSDLAAATSDLRRDDPDRYFASLFWPPAARPHAQALLAFNVEVARVRDAVSEPMLGEIRLQWWRDAIGNEAPGGNPLAAALLDTITRFNLDRSALLALIEARSFDLYDDPMPDVDALEAYLHATSSTLFEAIGRILAPGRLAPPCLDAAGRAYALTGLLRALPWQVAHGQMFVPLDLLARLQLPPEHVLARRNSPALGLVLNALRARVRNHLDEMEMGLAEAGPARGACLPAFLCRSYLRRMERPAVDPFSSSPEPPLWRRQWILWRAARRL